MIGTISIAGRIKEKPEMHVAEKPKPLKPLIIEAISTTNSTKQISTILSSKYDKKSTFIFFP